MYALAFVKGWLSKGLNLQTERNEVENPAEFTEPVREHGFIVGLQNDHAFEMSGLDSCVSDKMKTQQDLATNLLWPVDWPLNTVLTANKKYREE